MSCLSVTHEVFFYSVSFNVREIQKFFFPSWQSIVSVSSESFFFLFSFFQRSLNSEVFFFPSWQSIVSVSSESFFFLRSADSGLTEIFFHVAPEFIRHSDRNLDRYL